MKKKYYNSLKFITMVKFSIEKSWSEHKPLLNELNYYVITL